MVNSSGFCLYQEQEKYLLSSNYVGVCSVNMTRKNKELILKEKRLHLFTDDVHVHGDIQSAKEIIKQAITCTWTLQVLRTFHEYTKSVSSY